MSFGTLIKHAYTKSYASEDILCFQHLLWGEKPELDIYVHGLPPTERTPSETERNYSVHAQNYGITGPIKQTMGVQLEVGTS